MMARKERFLQNVRKYLKAHHDTDYIFIAVSKRDVGDPEAVILSEARVGALTLSALALLRTVRDDLLAQQVSLTPNDQKFVDDVNAALTVFGVNDSNTTVDGDLIGQTVGSA